MPLGRIERALDQFCNARECQTLGQKRLHRDLVCGVEHDRRRSAALQRAVRERETRESIAARCLELERAELGEIKSRQRSVPSLRIRKCVLNRQPHVRDAELREHRAVSHLD